MFQQISDELADDPTVDITTIGRTSGRPRRIEIWMIEIDGRFFIVGTPGPRDWLANLRADPQLTVHLKRNAQADIAANGVEVTDEATRRLIAEHPNAGYYRVESDVDRLVAEAPMVEVQPVPSM